MQSSVVVVYVGVGVVECVANSVDVSKERFGVQLHFAEVGREVGFAELVECARCCRKGRQAKRRRANGGHGKADQTESTACKKQRGASRSNARRCAEKYFQLILVHVGKAVHDVRHEVGYALDRRRNGFADGRLESIP